MHPKVSWGVYFSLKEKLDLVAKCTDTIEWWELHEYDHQVSLGMQACQELQIKVLGGENKVRWPLIE